MFHFNVVRVQIVNSSSDVWIISLWKAEGLLLLMWIWAFKFFSLGVSIQKVGYEYGNEFYDFFFGFSIGWWKFEHEFSDMSFGVSFLSSFVDRIGVARKGEDSLKIRWAHIALWVGPHYGFDQFNVGNAEVLESINWQNFQEGPERMGSKQTKWRNFSALFDGSKM